MGKNCRGTHGEIGELVDYDLPWKVYAQRLLEFLEDSEK